MAEALTAVNVGSSYLSEKFWPDLYRKASTSATPNSTPFVALSQQVDADRAGMPKDEWLQRALKSTTTTADTHPCLSDRLAAISAEASIALPTASTASDQLLGPSLDAVTHRLDDQWSKSVADGWRVQFERASKDREQLAELDRRIAEGETLSFDESFTHALLFDNAADDIVASVAALRLLHDQYPESHNVAVALGTRLLYQQDESGVGILEAVMNADANYSTVCAQAIYGFYLRHGRTAEAEQIAKRIGEKSEAQKLADEERATVLPTDTFVEHGLSVEVPDQMKQQIALIDEIDSLCLVQKACVHVPEQKSYVAGFTITGKWLTNRESKISAAMVGIRTHVPFPVDTMCFSLEGSNSAYLKRLRVVPASKIR